MKIRIPTISLLLLLSVLFLAPSLGAAEKGPLLYGPYVQAVSATKATVCWVEGAAEVKIGTSAEQLEVAGRKYIRHDLPLEGLKPSTRYFYQINEDGLARGNGQFLTAPSGSEPFTFAIYGDTRSRPEVHKQIADRIAAAQPALVLHTGDLVARGRKATEWDAFFSSAATLMRNIPMYPALGNHEDDSPLYYQFFILPGKQNYYSFDWGNVHFICLDSNAPRRPAGMEAKDPAYLRMTEEHWKSQQEWLVQDLDANQKAPFIVVFFHHPPYSTNVRRKANQEEMQKIFCGLLARYKVNIVFNGHDHNYQHHLVDGIRYIVTGGGGAPLYELGANLPAMTLKQQQIEHYMLAQVAPGKIDFQTVDLNGQKIDEFSVNARQVAAQ